MTKQINELDEGDIFRWQKDIYVLCRFVEDNSNICVVKRIINSVGDSVTNPREEDFNFYGEVEPGYLSASQGFVPIED